MHRAKNFQPEWGYVAGANSFKRTIQIVFVATAIGATAGGGVVLSLVDFPTGQASVAAHTTAASAQAAISAPAQPNPKAIVKSEIPFAGQQPSGSCRKRELSANPKNPEPADIARSAEVGRNGATAPSGRNRAGGEQRQPRSSALQLSVILRATGNYSGLCRAAVMMDVGAVFIRTVVTPITPGGDIW